MAAGASDSDNVAIDDPDFWTKVVGLAGQSGDNDQEEEVHRGQGLARHTHTKHILNTT